LHLLHGLFTVGQSEMAMADKNLAELFRQMTIQISYVNFKI
jgi:hypothetical protein